MASVRRGDPSELACAVSEVERVRGEAPPLFPGVLRHGAKLTAPFSKGPIDASVSGLREHAVSAYLSGQSDAFVEIEGKCGTGRLSPGTIGIVPRGLSSQRRYTGEVVVSHVYLPAERLHAMSDEVAHGRRVELVHRLGFPDPKLHAILSLLSEEAENGDVTSRLFLEQLIEPLCLQLIRAHSASALSVCVESPRGLAAGQLRRVKAYMLDHLGEDIGLHDMAELLGLSSYYFCTAFRMATGSTPFEWLTRQRLEKTQELLKDSTLRVTEISVRVGYATPSALAARFRRQFGVTPSEYRRRISGSKL